MPGDLPDYTKYITQIVTIPQNLQGPVIPRPKGQIKEKGAITTTSAYQTVASVTVTDAFQFQLSKIVVSTTGAAWIAYYWDGVLISCERLLDARTILIEHFPWDWHEMIGDGIKLFEVKAKYYIGAGTVNAEIVGEEV